MERNASTAHSVEHTQCDSQWNEWQYHIHQWAPIPCVSLPADCDFPQHTVTLTHTHTSTPYTKPNQGRRAELNSSLTQEGTATECEWYLNKLVDDQQTATATPPESELRVGVYSINIGYTPTLISGTCQLLSIIQSETHFKQFNCPTKRVSDFDSFLELKPELNFHYSPSTLLLLQYT